MAGRKRSEGFAFFIPVLGAMLIMPPLVLLFDVQIDIFGVPLIVAYLFTTWLALIIASFVLRKRLPNGDGDELQMASDRETRL